jgi:hypothetical protein
MNINNLPVDKKKFVMAGGLLLIMCFMWIRVFIGKNSDLESAKASIIEQEQLQQQSSSINVTYITLPNIQGRNDNLNLDFFDVKGWRDFGFAEELDFKNSDKLMFVGDQSGSEMSDKVIVQNLLKDMKLEAIVMGEPSEAFISNQLVSVGDFLKVEKGSNTYKFKVLTIKEDEVTLEYNELVVTVRISPSSDQTD